MSRRYRKSWARPNAGSFMLAACANSHNPPNATEDTPASAFSGYWD